MGVKFHDLIYKQVISFPQLKGKIIAIDAPNIIMNLLGFSYSHSPNNDNIMTDRTQRAISHLYGLLYRAIFYYSKQIYPIFCFDGRVSPLKRLITKDQLNDFLVVKKWYDHAIQGGNIMRARQIALGKEFFWRNIIHESKKLLGAMGVPYIESPCAAEAQCAYLVKNRMVDYANSQDYDSLLFGCPHTLQNLSKSLRRKIRGKWAYKKITPETIHLKSNLKTLQIDQFQLVDLAILIGTDYFEGIRQIGPRTALKLVRKYQNIERIKANERKNYDFSQLDSKLLQTIRKIFLFPDVITKFPDISWHYPNKDLIMDLMCRDHTLSKERVSNNILKLISHYKKARKLFITQQNKPHLIQTKLPL